MQFTKMLVMAVGASAAAIQVRGDGGSSPTCSSISVCKTGSKYSYCSKPSSCQSQSGSLYCCTAAGILNLLNCVNILNGNTINLNVGDIGSIL